MRPRLARRQADGEGRAGLRLQQRERAAVGLGDLARGREAEAVSARPGGDEPLEDPHGHLIPSVHGELQHRNLQRLSDFRSGQRVTIREVQDDNPDRLRHWQALGFTPGATVTILSFQPLDDIFEVQVGERLHRVGSEGLAGLRGELVS